ncbi:NAD-binding protein [Halomarina halobia]|uniref:NAD-binding protein n=1 Tax=Halomarina halobia TaxID=3033386 RepID=A0ABD6A4W2_9EURY|nr:NAD-binding protein [Halomarina sp. PSR21]
MRVQGSTKAPSLAGRSGANYSHDMTVLIIGDDAINRALAGRLDRCGHRTVLVGTDADAIEAARAAGLTAHRLDVTDAEALRSASLDDVATAIVSTDADSVNLLAAQTLVKYVDRVVVRINDPRNEAAFEGLNVDRVCTTTTLADALAETVERPVAR